MFGFQEGKKFGSYKDYFKKETFAEEYFASKKKLQNSFSP